MEIGMVIDTDDFENVTNTQTIDQVLEINEDENNVSNVFNDQTEIQNASGILEFKLIDADFNTINLFEETWDDSNNNTSEIPIFVDTQSVLNESVHLLDEESDVIYSKERVNILETVVENINSNNDTIIIDTVSSLTIKTSGVDKLYCQKYFTLAIILMSYYSLSC